MFYLTHKKWINTLFNQNIIEILFCDFYDETASAQMHFPNANNNDNNHKILFAKCCTSGWCGIDYARRTKQTMRDVRYGRITITIRV